jgi:hypothetical protein
VDLEAALDERARPGPAGTTPEIEDGRSGRQLAAPPRDRADADVRAREDLDRRRRDVLPAVRGVARDHDRVYHGHRPTAAGGPSR